MSPRKKKVGESGGKAAAALPLERPRSIEDLKGAAVNPRKISAEALAGLKVSLAQFGDVAGITWNAATGELVAGHQRVRALRALHGDALEVTEEGIRTPAGELFPVRVVSWERGMAAAANVAANNPHIAGEFDEGLEGLLREVAEWDAELFRGLELEGLGGKSVEEVLGIGGEEPDEEEAAAEAERREPITQPGDVWELREHRLMCGDATDREAVRLLMGGERARLFATDPPYLVGYEGSEGKAREDEDHGWDDPAKGEEFYQAFTAVALEEALTEDAAWYCWHASLRQGWVVAAWRALGVLVHQQIIWVKDRATMGRSRYLWGHEPCLFGWREGHPPAALGLEKLSTVWRVESVRPSVAALHPTAKPTELFAIPMRQHTLPGEVVFEPFAGSGSQILAAEQLGRRCRAMELSPVFCDRVVGRWVKWSGFRGVRKNGADLEWPR